MSEKKEILNSELPVVEIVCLGRRYTDDGKLYIRLGEAKPGEELGRYMDFETNKHIARLNCGTVYDMPAMIIEDGETTRWRLVPKASAPKRMWQDQIKREEWRTQDWAAKLAYDVDRQGDKETAMEALKLALRPQRRAYWRAGSRQRAVIEVLVLTALRTPLSVEERTKKG